MNNLKNINLPMPYYYKKKDVLLFVDNSGYARNEKNNINYFNNLLEPLETFTYASLYYPYEANDYSNSNSKHCHSFEEIIRILYKYPQSFKINNKHKLFYSIQEIEYLKRTQKLLLFYGLTDITNFEDNTRYVNDKCKKYISSAKWKINNQDLDKIINEGFIFKTTLEGKEKKFLSNEYTALLLDENYNVKAFIEFTNINKTKFKDIKDRCIKKDYNDEDELYIYNYNLLEKF